MSGADTVTAADIIRTATYDQAEPRRAAAALWRLVRKDAKLVVPYRESGGIPFYCIHPVAGDVTSYDKLFALIDPRQSIYGIQVPRSRMNASTVRSIPAMAEDYATAIAARHPDGPLMLGGYSAGAIIALEVAQVLKRRGRRIPLLVAIDGAPLNSGAALAAWHPLYLYKLARNLPGWAASRRAADWNIAGLRRRVVDKIVFRSTRRRTPGTPPREHLQVVDALVERSGWDMDQVGFIQALYDELHAYVPYRYDQYALVFEARVQPLLQLLQTGRIWRRVASSCDCIPIQGDHTTLMEGGTATAAVAARMNQAFAELRKTGC